MTFTVWSYDHDAAQFHANTFADFRTAVKTARQRVLQTCHNTGWAKVRDNNGHVGHYGCSGVVAILKKNVNGHPYVTSRERKPKCIS